MQIKYKDWGYMKMKYRNRRRIRKRKSTTEKTKMKFTAVLVIMIMTVVLGYLTARFIIGPILGYDTDESPIKVYDSDDSLDDESKNVNKEENTQKAEGGFALQFGVFSTKEAAQELVNSLAGKGIEADIIEENNQYKVISPIIQTKDEALGKLNEIKDKNVEDVFIASF